MSKLRVHNFAMSIDGYVAGPNQGLDDPLGEGGTRLHEWVSVTRFGRRMLGEEGGAEGIDDELLRRGDEGIAATIMGRNMFGPVRGAWPDASWTGWWGKDPPYHHPVFVLTHHARDPIPMQGGTTFHFVTGGIESALEQARDAAGALDARLGGGPRPCARTSAPAWSTSSTCRSCPSCWAPASGSSRTARVPTATSASGLWRRRRSCTPASPGDD
jgi:dihydrofolate reductase